MARVDEGVANLLILIEVGLCQGVGIAVGGGADEIVVVGDQEGLGIWSLERKWVEFEELDTVSVRYCRCRKDDDQGVLVEVGDDR